MEKIIGRKIDNYQIISILGKGGMGIVYKAYDVKLDRHVAIKMLNSQMTDKLRFIERFKREAKNQAKLSHPNIVTVYGFIEYEGVLGIVMEYVEGESLEKVIRRQKRLNLFDALYIGTQILNALGYAHSKGFIHRDIKPSNIIFNKEGVAKIMDFGISKSLFEKGMTKTGSKVGTVFYMSPEQVRGRDVSHHTDIYSVGCTLYEMIVGEPPFYSDNDYDIMDGHLKMKPPKLATKIAGTPEIIDEILFKALEKDINDRYQSCDEFISELHRLDNYLANIPTFRPEGKKQDKKKVKFYSIVGFSTFIALMLLLTWFVYGQVRELLTSDRLDELEKYNIQSLFESSDLDVTFEKITPVKTNTNYNLNSISFTNDGFGVILGDSGTCYYTTDLSKAWRPYTKLPKHTFHANYMLGDGKAILVGADSEFLYSEDNLQQLHPLRIQGDYTFFDIEFLNELTGFIVGSRGMILKTTDGGSNWKKMMNNTDNLLFDVSFINKRRGFIIGWDGIMMMTDDAGENWQMVPRFTRKYLKSIDFRNENGTVVGGNGTIYHSADSGESWEEISVPVKLSLQKVKYLTDDFVIILGSKGTILLSEDAGVSWNGVKSGTFSQLNDLAMSSDGKIYICGGNGTLLKIE